MHAAGIARTSLTLRMLRRYPACPHGYGGKASGTPPRSACFSARASNRSSADSVALKERAEEFRQESRSVGFILQVATSEAVDVVAA